MQIAFGVFAGGVFAGVFLRIDRGFCLGVSAYFCVFLRIAWGVFAGVFLRIDRGFCLGVSAYFCVFLRISSSTPQNLASERNDVHMRFYQ